MALAHTQSDATVVAAAEISNLEFALAHAANQLKRTESEKAVRSASEPGTACDTAR